MRGENQSNVMLMLQSRVLQTRDDSLARDTHVCGRVPGPGHAHTCAGLADQVGGAQQVVKHQTHKGGERWPGG